MTFNAVHTYSDVYDWSKVWSIPCPEDVVKNLSEDPAIRLGDGHVDSDKIFCGHCYQ